MNTRRGFILQKRCRYWRVYLHPNKRKESERELRQDSVWSEWQDLNLRPLDPQSSTLPAALHPDLQRSIKPCLNRIPNPEGKVKRFVKIPAENLLCSACFRCSRNNHRIRCTVCDTPHFSHHSTCFLSIQKRSPQKQAPFLIFDYWTSAASTSRFSSAIWCLFA